MRPLATGTALRIAIATAFAVAGLSAIAVLGSSSARPPAATPPVTAIPSATPLEVARPSPTPMPSPTSDPLDARVDQPTFAPDGRTGDPALDAVIDRLLQGDAKALATEFADVPARQEVCDPGCTRQGVPPDVWAHWLATPRRSLYAVYMEEEADAHIMLTVDVGMPVAQVWEMKVAGGRLSQIDIFPPHRDPGPVASPFYFLAAAYTPSPAYQYERFYVLPPRDALPKAPRMHAPSTRVAIPGVDALLEAVESGDPNAIRSRFVDLAEPLVRDCQGGETKEDAAFAGRWSDRIRDQLVGIHAVIRLPAGYQPRADHLVVLYRQLKPYWWTADGLLERDGAIVGLLTGTFECSAQGMYPPDRYIVPPPEAGISGLDPSRRSGIEIIDAILDGIQKRDLQALDALIDYTKQACGDDPDAPPGAGRPPCPSGVPPGALVDILPEIVCHGGFTTRDRAPAAVIEFAGQPFGLYAVVDGRDERGNTGSVWRVVTGTAALTVTERGVSRLDRRCGPSYPDALMGGSNPSFVLPPP